MTNYLSSKLTVLYTLLIVMVVYIHSYYLEAEQYPLALFIQKAMGGVFSVANCLFFCISGYLFARNIKDLKDVFGKQQKRIRTLLIPYILWNLIFVMWYVVLENVPGVSAFNNSSGLVDKYLDNSILECLNNLFVQPAAFQLWFLRDLLCMLVLTPILYYCAKKNAVLTIVLAMGMTFVWGWLTYYWLGILIGAQQWNLESYPKNGLMIGSALIIFVGHAIYVALGQTSYNWVGTIVNIIGLYLVWALYDVFAKGKCLADKGIWKYICGYSFFIYCFHEPAFNIIKKLALVIFGKSEPVLIFFYFINPWLMVFFAIVVARLLMRFTPKVYSILTGGR